MKEYSKDSKGPEKQFGFESTKIELDLPMEDGKNLKNGWKIIPLTNPVVSCYYLSDNTYSSLCIP